MAIEKKYLPRKKVTKVTFSLPAEAAPTAKEIRLVGDFNDWNWEAAQTMKLSKNVFKTELEFTKEGSYEFRYQIDQSTWANDWEADAYVAAPFAGIDNSVVAIEKAVTKAKAAPKAKATKAAPVAKKAVAKATKATPVAKKVTAKKKSTKKVKKADLTIIEGVGPKLKQILTDAGFGTFDAVAAAKVADLKAVLAAAGNRYKMHNPTTWPQQATLAAAEKWAELKTLQDELDGGRVK